MFWGWILLISQQVYEKMGNPDILPLFCHFNFFAYVHLSKAVCFYYWTGVPHQRQPTIDSARKAQWFVKWSFRLAIYNFYRPSRREILKFQTLVGTFLGGLMWKSLLSIFNLEPGTKGILSIISDSMTFVKACWQALLKRRIIKKISSSENEIF